MTTKSKANAKKAGLKKKALVVLCALVGVVAIVVTSVLATVAYLTSSATISNTFTIGEVGITMDEALVDADGKKRTGEDAGRSANGNNYTLVPGATYDKDPTIHVTEGSQDSYLFAIIDNEISGAVCQNPTKPGHEKHKTIAMQLAENGWAKYTTVNIGTVYVYAGFDAEGNSNVDLVSGEVKENVKIPAVNKGSYVLFETFSIDENTVVKNYNGAKIAINAIAIQDTTFEGNITAAWEAVMSTYSYIVNGGSAG